MAATKPIATLRTTHSDADVIDLIRKLALWNAGYGYAQNLNVGDEFTNGLSNADLWGMPEDDAAMYRAGFSAEIRNRIVFVSCEDNTITKID